MKPAFKFFSRVTIVLSSLVLLFSFYDGQNASKPKFKFPYKQAGLTERQAAAHLLSRFTFGAKPGDVDAVVNMGLEKWFEQQLDAGIADDSLNGLLAGYESLKMSNTEIENTYPKNAQVLRRAIKDGDIDKDSVNKSDKKEYRDQVKAYMDKNGMKPQQELFRQQINQKILRADVSNNQLQEVLTDFWFNHFNVSLTKNDCAGFIPNYERDVIRPNVTAKFEELLLATAKSPAMLMYLDNFSSSGTNTDMDKNANALVAKRIAAKMNEQMNDTSSQAGKVLKKLQQAKKSQGLNENYAREVMELHTLGVDGGYTQQDVTQAARVLTGWTIYPMSDYGYGNAMKKLVDKIGEDKLTERGFVHDGDFLFAASRHDNGEKTVLGKSFSNNGYQEGVELLKMLANHPSTAKFICKKLAVRFVNDNPSQTLIDKMAKTFLDKKGDIKQVLITMATAPEFWSKDAIREKTKSPFELAISSARSLNATITEPFQLYNWINKMGQKMYYYQAPTGFPDKGQYWINTGALLNRMNFGLALASQRIPGIKIDLYALNNRHEPESAEAALATYSKLVMPERDLTETVKRLTPLLNDPELEKKVSNAAGKSAPANQDMNVAAGNDAMKDDMMMSDDGNDKKYKERLNKKGGLGKNAGYASMPMAAGNNSMLGQVVGIIIGSPEFQRR